VQLDKRRGVAKPVEATMIDSLTPYNLNLLGLSN
jgi:hypothetical protein